MDPAEYIVDMKESFSGVWEPEIEREFNSEIEKLKSSVSSSNPYHSALKRLEKAEKDFEESGAEEARCRRDIETYSDDIVSADEDFWREKINAVRDDVDLNAVHSGVLNQWRRDLEAAMECWKEQAIDLELSKLYARFRHKLKTVKRLKDSLKSLEAFGRGWDLSASELMQYDSAELLEWLKKIENNAELKRLCELIGRMAANDRIKERERVMKQVEYQVPRVDSCIKEEIAGVTFGKSIEDSLPSELATCGDPDLETLFDLKFIEGHLMSFERQGITHVSETKDEAVWCEKEGVDSRGPVIICVDTSGSMSGDPETVAKAVTLAVTMQAKSEKRKCYLIEFSTETKALEIGYGATMKDFLNFLSNSFSGGTDAVDALKAGIAIMQKPDYEKADLLLVSDFEIGKQGEELNRLMSEQKQRGSRFFALAIRSNGIIIPWLSMFSGVKRDKKWRPQIPSGFDRVWKCDPAEFGISEMQRSMKELFR